MAAYWPDRSLPVVGQQLVRVADGATVLAQLPNPRGKCYCCQLASPIVTEDPKFSCWQGAGRGESGGSIYSLGSRALPVQWL